MAQLASTHSRGYWMHVTRRVPPRPLGSGSVWTVYLYRRVTLARRTPSTRLNAGGQALPLLFASSGKLSRHVADHLNQMQLGIRPNLRLQGSSDGVHPPVLSLRLWN